MSTYIDKPLSLIEKKKQQWAREKEELSNLDAPWTAPKLQTPFDQPFQRGRYASKFAMANAEFFRKSFASSSSLSVNRRSSLPPLYKNQFNSIDRDVTGGETSGYGSDNPAPFQSGYESSSSCKDDRPKWRDSKCWEGAENEPPNWVKRGLETDEEIVVTNTSPSESPQQEEMDAERPSSPLNRTTYIRGQNIPLDSLELAERERRRQVALAHQEAIRQQLEDRERRRLHEKQKRIQEEQEEELRLERDQEIERQRKEQELKSAQTKIEQEDKRNETIQKAIEKAEKEAKLAKIKQKTMRQTDENENITIIHNKIDKEAIVLDKTTNLPKTANLEVGPLNTELQTNDNRQYVVLVPSYESTPRTQNRVLTPTQYRSLRCDSSTQTDFPILDSPNDCSNLKYIKEKLASIELSLDQQKTKRKSTAEERSVEERPKWGANRPPTRYLKQSEKDPLYQRRQLRQKTYKNSSDESSPRSGSRREKRRLLWRKSGRCFSENVRMYQTEMVPLEVDRERIYCSCCCCCRKALKVSSARERLPSCNANTSACLIGKLASLHDGLLMHQERWKRTPSS